MVSVKDKSNFDKKTSISHGDSPRGMYGPGGIRTRVHNLKDMLCEL